MTILDLTVVRQSVVNFLNSKFDDFCWQNLHQLGYRTYIETNICVMFATNSCFSVIKYSFMFSSNIDDLTTRKFTCICFNINHWFRSTKFLLIFATVFNTSRWCWRKISYRKDAFTQSITVSTYWSQCSSVL